MAAVRAVAEMELYAHVSEAIMDRVTVAKLMTPKSGLVGSHNLAGPQITYNHLNAISLSANGKRIADYRNVEGDNVECIDPLGAAANTSVKNVFSSVVKRVIRTVSTAIASAGFGRKVVQDRQDKKRNTVVRVMGVAVNSPPLVTADESLKRAAPENENFQLLDPLVGFDTIRRETGSNEAACANAEPVVHYLSFGAKEVQDCRRKFSTSPYFDRVNKTSAGDSPLVMKAKGLFGGGGPSWSMVDSGSNIHITPSHPESLREFDGSSGVQITGFNGSVAKSRGRGTMIRWTNDAKGDRVAIHIPN